MSFDLGAIVARLELDINKWSANVATARADANQLAGNILKNKEQIQDLGKTMTVVGGAISAGFIMAASANGKFNKSMADIATLIPNSSSRVNELKRDVEKLAIATGKGTDDMSRGLYEIISAYGDSADSVKMLEINARAATAGMATTLDSIRLTSAVTKGYGDISAEATQKVADLSFLTVKLGQTTFPELAQAIGGAIPLAAALKVKQTELFGAMATLTGVTGNANEVTTQLQATMRGFMRPTEEMKSSMAALGYTSAETMIQQEGLVGSLRKVIGTTDGSAESLGKLFQRVEGLTAVMALTGGQAAVFDSKFKQMERAGGSAAEAFNEVANGINKNGFAAQQSAQKMEAALRRFGEVSGPIIASFRKIITEAITAVTKFADAHPALFKAIATLTFVIGALMAVAGPLLLMLPTLAKSFTVLAPIVNGAAGGIGKLIGSMSGFGAAAIPLAAVIGTVIVVAIQKWNKALDEAISKIQETAKVEHTNTLLIRNAYKNLTPEVVAEIKKKIKAMRESGMEWDEINKKIVASYNLEKIKGAELVKNWENNNENKKKSSEELLTALKDAYNTAIDTIKKATMSEWGYAIWAAKEKARIQIEELKKLGATEQQMAPIRRALEVELTQINLAEGSKRVQAYKNMVNEIMKLQTMQHDAAKKKADAETKKTIAGTAVMLKNQKFVAQQIVLAMTGAWVTIGNSASANFAKVKKSFSETMQSLKGYIQVLQQGFSDFFSGMNKMSENRYQKEFDRMDAEYEKKRKAIEDSLMSEEEKNAALTELDDEYAKKKRALEIKQAEATKKSGITQALINTALAITSALSTKPFFPMGLIAAVAAAAAGAIQIATIKSTPLPAMAAGGLLTKATPVIAGEAGPEAFVPLPDLKEMLGVSKRGRGEVPSINFYIKALDGADVLKVTRKQIIPEIRRALGRESLRVPAHAIG